MPSIKVHKSGLCTTVQDIGRIGYQQFGIPVSGVIPVFKPPKERVSPFLTFIDCHILISWLFILAEYQHLL